VPFEWLRQGRAVSLAKRILWQQRFANSRIIMAAYRVYAIAIAIVASAALFRDITWLERLVGGLVALAFLTVGLYIERILRSWIASMRRELSKLTPRCAVCEYELAGLTPAEDGCTTCPECGAAWRLNPPLSFP
jgi:hypothetical protein